MLAIGQFAEVPLTGDMLSQADDEEFTHARSSDNAETFLWKK